MPGPDLPCPVFAGPPLCSRLAFPRIDTTARKHKLIKRPCAVAVTKSDSLPDVGPLEKSGRAGLVGGET
jgi:hypothetical protein